MHAELRKRLQQDLQAQGVDVYVACTPSNVHYTSGFQSSFLDLSWQMTGTDMVVLPSAEDLEPAIIVSEYCVPLAAETSDIQDIRAYSMWTEGRDFKTVAGSTGADNRPLQRPEQYEPREIFALLNSILQDRGLGAARIGTNSALMKHGTYEWFRRSFPDQHLIDCEHILYGARKLKHPQEIERLTRAATLFDIGVEHTVSRIHVGQTADMMRYDFEAGVAATLRQQPEARALGSKASFSRISAGWRVHAWRPAPSSSWIAGSSWTVTGATRPAISVSAAQCRPAIHP